MTDVSYMQNVMSLAIAKQAAAFAAARRRARAINANSLEMPETL
ncbi:MAG: hypothetical protein ACSHXZ_13895 [Gammaproteobacteria bacterium]